MTEKAAILDLETGGTRPGDAIFSIGAVCVDLDTSDVTDFFYRVIDIASAEKHGLLTTSTMLWWGAQDKTARAEIFEKDKPSAVDLFDAIDDFAKWYRAAECKTIWGNGATFDISMLEHFYLKFEIPLPWDFWDVRDIRTLVHLVGREYRDQFEFEGVEHHALHDAAHEAKYTSAMWQRARKGLEILSNESTIG